MAGSANEELKKIAHFVCDGAAMSDANGDLVRSREFFEMWEQLHHPIPFQPATPALRLAGRTITLPTPQPIVWLEWDSHQGCATLVAENSNISRHYGLRFADGKLHVDRPSRRQNRTEEASFGELLEVMYELISHHRAAHPTRNAASMTRRECRALLTDLPQHASAAHIRDALMRLDAAAFETLLSKAIEDMAMDELSNQLTLALDGSYAQDAPPDENPKDTATASAATEGAPHVPTARTPWSIRRELLFLQIAIELVAQAEQDLILPLATATILDAPDACTRTLRVPTPGGNAIPEGTRLSVFDGKAAAPIAWLTAHICEHDHLIGRLAWQIPSDADDDLAGLQARPPRSPGFYAAAELGHLSEEIARGGVPGDQALGIMLGIGATHLCGEHTPTPALMPPPPHRHTAQLQAWQAATDTQRAVVLIQGPPGTGKTSVLEDTIRTLVDQGQRVLLAAPSNTAVDNAARRLHDLPLLRTGRNSHAIATDQAHRWSGTPHALRDFLAETQTGGFIIAGTHIGMLRDDTVNTLALERPFDTIVFDEAGMAPLAELLLCSRHARRAVLFGDHQQLPPFPISPRVTQQLSEAQGAISNSMHAALERSALEWLSDSRHFPVILLQHSFRCQNPRLMRFASTLFYNAQVRASKHAEYFSLPYAARQQKYPPSSLSLFCTSELPEDLRAEKVITTGNRPGIENKTEAIIIAHLFYHWIKEVPLEQIAIITPYRRQARRIRRTLSRRLAEQTAGGAISEDRWNLYLQERIATVDGFQGDESDVVLISYVRSNARGSVGFSDDPNRINVAHTRCRRAMAVVADISCLQAGARTPIFKRMERAFRRDGEMVDITSAQLESWKTQLTPPQEQPSLL